LRFGDSGRTFAGALGHAVPSSSPSEPPRSSADARVDDRLAAASQPSAFATLDELVRSGTAVGLLHVRGEAATLKAVARHIERRARGAQRALVQVAGEGADDAWRELADRLGARKSTDPADVAASVVGAAGGAMVVVSEAAGSEWGEAIVAEIARLAGPAEAPLRALFVVLARHHTTDRHERLATDGAPRIWQVDLDVDPRSASDAGADARLWWDALAADAGADLSGRERIDALERWWSAARALPVDASPPPVELSPPAQALHDRLRLARRCWPASRLELLGTRAALSELCAARAAELDGQGWVVVASSDEPEPVTHAAQVAAALKTVWPVDPWANARAAELFAIAGRPEDAESAMHGAIGAVTDATVRADLWRRWDAALSAMPREGARERNLRAASLALRVGDSERALSFSKVAAGGDAAASCEVMLTLGRATAAHGDLMTASIALGKAMERAPDGSSRARAEAELAEVRYTQGDFEGAERHANQAIAAAGDMETTLLARNTLGKLHLAAARWAEAEQHFAADACEAACAGDGAAELRARVNRAIALLSCGRHHDAQGILEGVLADGEARGELRALAFAYSNLSVIAAGRHDYARALDLCERAIAARRRVGDRVGLASILVTNLADMRLRVGMAAEAEQALVFGRQMCGSALPSARAAHFAMTSARVCLATGRTLEARAEIEAAIRDGAGSSDGGFLCKAYRIVARIALEHGDLAAARTAIEKAADSASGPSPRAEVALLQAMLARASGEPFADHATEALEQSRDDEHGDTGIEACVLLAHAAHLDADPRAVRVHLDAAIALRNRIATSLPVGLRERYLARRELAELAALEASPPVSMPSPAASRAPVISASGGAPVTGARRLVGEDASIRALWSAIQKVGHSDATVLVFGESGTGKELVAEALHEASPRRAGPLVKVNCSALVETLLLSELFGHEKGSFTGAAARRRGRFELAEGGTIFLDEIGDISPRTQVALLRVLQDRTFERVGGVTPLRANVRIVCATHRDLKAMVARGEFREDLYYRLRGVVLEVPALRTRLGDLSRIAEALLVRIADERRASKKALSAGALEVLLHHNWPGNVRELENALRAAALFADGEVIQAGDFTENVDGLRHLGAPISGFQAAPSLGPETLRMAGAASRPDLRSTPPGPPDSLSGMYPALSGTPTMIPPPSPSGNALDGSATPTAVAYARVREGVSLHDMKRQIEEECIARALAESKGNITKAAALLGMKRPRLSQLVKQYGLGGASEDG
jgi:transcriptional regulator with GAF, ATPase, and Fis domain/tetratricopeptide (TPR) repeat protein